VSIRSRKVVGDARENGVQVALIALVLTLGTAGVVAVLDAQAILKREIAASYESARAPDIALWFDRVPPEVLAEVAAHEDVAAVEARRVAFTRVRARDGSWLPMRLTILRDIESQRVGSIHRHSQAASGGAAGLWIEQSGRALIAADTGEPVRVRTPTGGLAALPLAGYVHDTSVAPSTQDRVVYAFATHDAAALVGQNPDADQLIVKMKHRGDTGDAVALGEALRERLRAIGQPPLRVDALANAHPHAALMNAMLRVLGVISAIAFTCSAALSGYLVSVWMRREVRLVGIMKAMGARWHQVAMQYLLLVGPLALAVTAIALPAGAAIGRIVVRYYANALNIDVVDWDVAARLALEEGALTLGVALAAMAWPIVRASRMSVHEAIHDPGIASALGAGSRVARSIALPGGMRWTFAVRNTLRRPLRLALILLALSSGGALLLTLHSNYESLMSVIDTSLAAQGHDIEVFMPRAVPGAVLESVARRVAGVELAEAWRRASVTAAQEESDPALTREAKRVTLLGYPPGSRLFTLPVLEGRLPASSASNEMLMTRTVRDSYPELRVGSEAPLRFRDRRVNVRVVGVVEEIGTPTFYAAFPTFDAITALGDAATVLRAKAGGGHPELVASALDEALLDAHLPAGQLVTRAMFRDSLDEHFKVVGDVMQMVALAVALIGAIVLGASTALDVLERRREIGVMRALGATPRGIAAILLAESATIAALGALLSIVISLALTKALNEAAARNLLHVAVPLHFSLEGLAVLCASALVVIVAVGTTLALSLRRTAREAMSYEG
jgi:putative ABC transport system permease protein